MATNRPRYFDRMNTIEELDDNFEMMTSPECLYADGERSRTQANALYKRLRTDYDHRASEIRLAELNAMRGTPTR